jgi:hypothetical protein
MGERIVKPSSVNVAFRDEMIVLLRKHAGEQPAHEMLAVAAYTVGQILALQDQRTMTKDRAMEIVFRNLEVGNRDAISTLLNSTGGNA